MSSNNHINAVELKQRLENKETLNLLDVREPIEFHSHNIGGNNIPLNKLLQNPASVPYSKTDEVIVICRIGKRSKTAQSILEENGYQQVRNLNGGLLALQKLRS